MKDTALQRVAREPHAGKQKAERRALFLKSQSHASVIDLPLIQRTPFCACGGGCPRCEKSALPIQTKLRISAPADEYEQEADRVAEQVMRMPQPAIQRASCASCEVGGSTSPECEANEKDLVQRKAATPSSHKGASVPNNFLTAPGIGQPLDSGTRAFMEERFGHDFGHVRVHTDARAAESARDVAAKAYTVGSDIVFGQGRFAPTDGDGLALLAHELAHVVQQSASPSPLVAHHTVPHIARAPLDVDAIVKDVEGGSVEISPFAALMSLPFIKSLTQGIPSGDITMAADYPTSFTLPADKTKPVAALPKADSQPPLSNIPVVAHFFPAIWAGTADRALVIGGFHGDERPGWEIAEKLVSDFNQAFTSNVALAFHTIVIPRLNAAAIADELAGVRMWGNRCNRQLVDLNRNFPTGNKPKDTDCKNTEGAPIQPEVQAVMDIITKFKPTRILSLHAISTPAEAGVFADPNQDPKAVEIAKGMSATLVNPSDRPFNRLGPGSFNPVYPKDKPGVVGAGTSLGAWGPTAAGATNRPVITMEAPGFSSLATGPGTAPRTVEGFMRPVLAFLGDPTLIDKQADLDILSDIDALQASDRLAFLTGRLSRKNDIFRRINERVQMAIASLNAIRPKSLPKIEPKSPLRLFSETVPGGGGTPQAEIDFNKFFLTGSMSGGWDTLPDQYFINGDRKKGPDVKKWLAAPSKDRLEIIVKFSSLPGASRHHWNTEVDVNSVEVADWMPSTTKGQPDGKFYALGQWLSANSAKAGLIQSYSPGRPAGGYADEPWHFSYAPISVGLLDRYNKTVNLKTDVIDEVVAEFQKRAKEQGLTLPTDFATALGQINVSDLVNTINPALKPPP